MSAYLVTDLGISNDVLCALNLYWITDDNRYSKMLFLLGGINEKVQFYKIYKHNFNILINSAKSCFVGWKYLFCVLSMALLISSLYALTSYFEWKLLNTVILFFGTFLVLCVNTAYYYPIFDVVKHKIMNNSFFNMLGTYINEPLLFVLNTVFVLVCIILGIVMLTLGGRKNES